MLRPIVDYNRYFADKVKSLVFLCYGIVKNGSHGQVICTEVQNWKWYRLLVKKAKRSRTLRIPGKQKKE